ncbi:MULTISPECIES: protein kinase [unclassified Streptomyces]|uniref:protein kinase domain-containing protein n=1 Tax=unclassified Streptomyces TaxID=2593676 RepID=UPI0036E89755
MTEQPYTVEVPAGYRVGPWVVREPLAAGAFGSVYAARLRNADTDTDTDAEADTGTGTGTGTDGLPKTAALKFLPTGTRTPRQLNHLRELAEREVELLSRLRSPRLIRLYDTVTIDDPGNSALDGVTVLVLERAEGSLADLLARPQPPASGPALLAQICEGLHQLHQAGWVHGDLKPANVLLMKDGSARLADFNMAAELEGTHAYAPAFATPDYTPPELLWADIGERGRQIRPTADVWAFGVLAHQVLTGTYPLPGGTPSARGDAAVRYTRGTEELRLSPELPDGWREIITDCLARTHEERAAHDSGTVLRRVESVAGTARSPRLPRLRPRRVRPRIAIVTALAAALLGTGAALTLYDGGSDPATYGSAELRTDRGVPVTYRRTIVDAAHGCNDKDVTPAMIAALLKVESDFDPDLADPAKDEYGIARWTPGVLWYWIDTDRRTKLIKDLKPPFPPDVSIRAVGRYTCEISRRLKAPAELPGNRGVLIATGYVTSAERVNTSKGVPSTYRGFAARIEHYLKEYTAHGDR